MTYGVETTLCRDTPLSHRRRSSQWRWLCPGVGATNGLGKVSQTMQTGAETIEG